MSNSKTVKQLRKEAIALINKNVNSIDGRSIAKFSQIALNAQSSKVQHLINQLKDIGTKKTITTNKANNLDKDIEDVKPAQQPKKKQVTLKDVFKKKTPPSKFVDFDVRVKILYDQYNPTRKHQKPYKTSQEQVISVSVPKNKINDKKYIEFAIYNEDVSGYIRNPDSMKVNKIHSVEILSKPISKSDMYKKDINIKDIKMKHAEYVNLDIDGIREYKFEPFKCVYGALKYKYGFNEQELLSIFRQWKTYKTAFFKKSTRIFPSKNPPGFLYRARKISSIK